MNPTPDEDLAKSRARARFELARSCISQGELRRAEQALRQACQIEATTLARRSERITYLSSLGEVLERLGELEDAENVLRQALGERATFYGVAHPGYAFGLTSLAALELARGRAVDARCLCDQALHVLLEARHPRAGEVAALRAFCVAARPEADVEPFVHAGGLDEAAFSLMVRGVLDRAAYAEPRQALAALGALRPLLVERRGEADGLLLHLVAAIANRARDAAQHDLRMQAYAWLAVALDRAGDGAQAVDALLGLALAASDAGQPELAEQHHRRAVERAQQVGARATSTALRNFGLFLSERGRPDEALSALEAALGQARAAGDAELGARALVALGIFRLHAGERSEARARLCEGLGHLPATDPDALCAQSHLGALERGESCGCTTLRRCEPNRSSTPAAPRG